MEQHRFGAFALAISRIHYCIQHLKTTEMQQYNLKAVHVMCLYLLKEHPEGLTPTEIVEHTREDKAAISRALKDLRARGLVRDRDEGSAHAYRVPAFLTNQGAILADEVRRKVHDIFAQVAPEITPEERATFYRVLFAISDNLMANQK